MNKRDDDNEPGSFWTPSDPPELMRWCENNCRQAVIDYTRGGDISLERRNNAWVVLFEPFLGAPENGIRFRHLNFVIGDGVYFFGEDEPPSAEKTASLQELRDILRAWADNIDRLLEKENPSAAGKAGT